MDSFDWTIIKTLYEQQNITKTAELLFVSQPALSYRIQQTEKEFGCSIITRGKKGIKFTAQGEILYKYSVDMLEQMRHIKESLAAAEKQVSGLLKIGATRSLIKNYLPQYLERFSREYPNVEYSIKTGHSREIAEMTRTGGIHIGFVRGGTPWNGEKKLVLSEDINIVSYNEVTYEELPSLNMIAYNTESSFTRAIDYWWKGRYSQGPKVVMSVDNLESAWEMVRHRIGYAILPKTDRVNSNGLFLLPLKTTTGETITRESWMIYQENALLLPLAKAFIGCIEESL